MDWFSVFLCGFGLWLNARKCIWAWPVWLLSNVTWSTYALQTHQPSLLVLQFIYCGLNVYGWWSWRVM